MGKRIYPLNEKVFDVVNPVNAYWIGLLYADGACTSENKIRLWLAKKDERTIHQFRNFLQTSQRPIKERMSAYGGVGEKRPYVGLDVRSWRIHNKIRKYELTVRKENRRELHIDLLQPEIRRHFIRGLFDGDGGFYVDKRGYLFAEITGYLPVLRSVKSILVLDNITTEKKKIVKNGKNVHRIRLSAGDTLKLAEYMYEGALHYMRRKYNMYKLHAERLNKLGGKLSLKRQSGVVKADDLVMRPISQWNEGKSTEWKERITFNVDK